MIHSTPPCPPSQIVERWQAHFPELKTPSIVYTSPRRQAQLRADAGIAAKLCGRWADEMADKYGQPRPSRGLKP